MPLTFNGFLQPGEVPVDPTGASWRGPPGPVGPAGHDPIAPTPGAAVLEWPAAAGVIVTNGSYELTLAWPWQTGTITGITADTASGSFVAAVMVNGASVAGLGAVTVSSSTPVTTAAGINTVVAGNNLSLVITGATGPPTDATVQVSYTRSFS